VRSIASIVEGHGDVKAVPILLRRLARRLSPAAAVDILKPIRIGRYKIVKPGELERAVELAARQTGERGSILILLDAEDDCPAALGPALLERAIDARRDRDIRVVLAKREYEAWFLAAIGSIAGSRGIDQQAAPPDDPEIIRDAKGWLTAHRPPGWSYRETLDQPALSAIFDIEAALAAPSFDKLWRDVSWLLRTD